MLAKQLNQFLSNMNLYSTEPLTAPALTPLSNREIASSSQNWVQLASMLPLFVDTSLESAPGDPEV